MFGNLRRFKDGLALRRWVAGEPDMALQPPARVTYLSAIKREASQRFPETAIFNIEEHRQNYLIEIS